MRQLYTFDIQDYEGITQTKSRTAICAIIIQHNKLAMIKSTTFMECKFPSGGLEMNEAHEQCLMREIKEETGLKLLSSTMIPYGWIKEKRKDSFHNHRIFEMTSYYYLAKVSHDIHPLNLDDYEKQYGYHMVWLSLDEAIHQNEQALALHHDVATWIERELFVLKCIKQEGLMSIDHS